VEQLTQVIRILKTPVTLIALLALLFGSAYWGYKAVTTENTVAQVVCVMTDVGPELTPKSVQVRSLNAGAGGGKAKLTANTTLRPYGFQVIRVNNADDDRLVTGTVIVGNAVNDPEVRLVMQFFPGAVAEGDGRADHVVDVLIGQGFQIAAKPVTTLKVDGPVCLPPPLTGAASASAASASASAASASATATATPTSSSSAKKK
jgi:hypothetical protein